MWHKVEKEHILIFIIILGSLIIFNYFDQEFQYTGLTYREINKSEITGYGFIDVIKNIFSNIFGKKEIGRKIIDDEDITQKQKSDEIKKISDNIIKLNENSKEQTGIKKQETVNLIKQNSKERKQKLLALMEEDPESALELVIPKKTSEQLSAEIQQNIEKEVLLKGDVEIAHYDDFKNQQSRNEYYIVKDDKKLRYYPTQDIKVTPRTKVQIKGYQIEDKIIGLKTEEAIKIIQAPTPKLDSIGDQKILVLLINFLDSPQPPFSREKAKEIIFNGQIQKFFKEASYEKASFSGDVYGWHTIQRNGIVDGRCNWPSFYVFNNKLYELDFILNQTYLDKYSRLVLLVNHPCMYGGSASIGKTTLIKAYNKEYFVSYAMIGDLKYYSTQVYNHPFSWTLFDMIISHEMTHNLGVNHAHSFVCDNNLKTLYGTKCIGIEYGNKFDIMGRPENSIHQNVVLKETLNWLDQSSLLNIDKSGVYTIKPLESANGKRVAKIQNKNIDAFFYLEHRKGIGFDSKLNEPNLMSSQNGLFVYLVNLKNNYVPPYNYLLDPILLDMSPDGLNYWSEVTLNKDTGVFEDPFNNIVIGPVLKVDDSGITFIINFSNSVTLIFPNGGEKLIRGKNYNIRWLTNSIEKNKVIIKVQKGSSIVRTYNCEDKIAKIKKVGDFSCFEDEFGRWTIPQSLVPDNDYKILIECNIPRIKCSDSSDKTFTIV